MIGRRTVLAVGAVLVTAPAAGLAAPASAAADQAVVQAIVFGGAADNVFTRTVTAGTLAALGCPLYSGGAPFVLQPSGQPYQPAPGSSWSLDTILSCGLQIPAATLTDVAVQRPPPQTSFEAPLSAAEVSDPGQYQDPTAQSVLPVVSLDGGQSPVTYTRPARGPSDPNGADQVITASAPLTLVVYERAPALTVRIAVAKLSPERAGERERLSATATDASGRAVDPTQLSWSWNFGDGSRLGAGATPAHTFAKGGAWPVTVVVTDRAAGTGGTATITVAVDAQALKGPTNRSGAGPHRHPRSPTGAVTGGSAAPSQGAPAHPRTGASSSPSSGGAPKAGQPSSSPASSTASSAGAATRAIPPAGPVSSSPRHHTAPGRSHHHYPAAHRQPAPPPAGATRLVSGVLIADVTPAAAGASPLVHASPAPSAGASAVRAATRTSVTGGWLVALAMVALLALGAGRELRGRRRSHYLLRAG